MGAGSSRVEFSVWELMYVGSNLTVLRNASARTPITSTRYRRVSIVERLHLLGSDLASLELSQSERALHFKPDEHALRSDLDNLIKRLEHPERSNPRLGHDAVCLRTLIKRVERVLQSEASSRTTFVVQRSREGEIEKLLQDPIVYFGIPSEGSLKLTPQGSDDFREAARCYAVGFTAASIMFMLRATEEVLRSYYEQVTAQPASGAWGNLTTILKIPVLRCPSPLTTQLEKLVKKRNDAMHPKARLPTEWDDEAAKQVLKECRQVIMMMVEDLKNRRDAHVENEKST